LCKGTHAFALRTCPDQGHAAVQKASTVEVTARWLADVAALYAYQSKMISFIRIPHTVILFAKKNIDRVFLLEFGPGPEKVGGAFCTIIPLLI